MKSKANNRLISRLLCTCTMDSHILMVGEDGLLNDDEANVLMISYMIEAVRNCKRVIRIISDDTTTTQNANYNKVTFRNYTLLLERRQPHNAMKIYWKLDKTFLLLFMVSQSARVWIRYMIYTKKKGKPPLVKSLPPTDKNLLLQMLRAHCQAL